MLPVGLCFNGRGKGSWNKDILSGKMAQWIKHFWANMRLWVPLESMRKAEVAGVFIITALLHQDGR